MYSLILYKDCEVEYIRPHLVW